jgi:hypothetical protein
MLIGGLGSNFLQLFGTGNDPITLIVYILLTVVSFAVVFMYGQRIQAYSALRDVRINLEKLQGLKEKSRKEAIDYMNTNMKAPKDAQQRVDQVLEYFTIMPVDVDPSGIVGKIEHVTTQADDRIRAELRSMAPQADPVQLSVAQNILEVATSLNMLFKIVRHFYIQGQKTKSIYIIVQLQMILPMVIQEADALTSAIDAFKLAQPIGDGMGPIVAGKLMVGKEKTTIERETVYSRAEYKGRSIIALKAEGPMGTVGRPHLGVEKIVGDPANKISTIIMIDAALKLEGENTGEVAEGVGAAIGGIGTEKFRIEAVATQKDIPMYAIVVKQSLIDAISVMRKEIAEATDKVIERVHRVIEEKTKEGDTVLLVGVGNTLGVAQ